MKTALLTVLHHKTLEPMFARAGTLSGEGKEEDGGGLAGGVLHNDAVP